MLRIAGIAFVLGCLAALIPLRANEERIEAAFGFRLGEVFTPEPSVRTAVTTGDVITYTVPAPKAFRSMTECRIAVTPKSGRIVSITAESQPFETLGEAQREAMLLVSLLKEKYLPKTEDPSPLAPPPPPIAQPPAAGKATSQIKAVIATPQPAKSPVPTSTPPAPKLPTSFKARRGPVDSPFTTDATFKQGNRSISTELISVIGTMEQSPAKPCVQVTYADQDMAQMAARERQELDRQRARLWIEEQAQHSDASGL